MTDWLGIRREGLPGRHWMKTLCISGIKATQGSKCSVSPFTYNVGIYEKFRVQISLSLTLGLNSESPSYSASCVNSSNVLPLPRS